jgi:hypothetical protein
VWARKAHQYTPYIHLCDAKAASKSTHTITCHSFYLMAKRPAWEMVFRINNIHPIETAPFQLRPPLYRIWANNPWRAPGYFSIAPCSQRRAHPRAALSPLVFVSPLFALRCKALCKSFIFEALSAHSKNCTVNRISLLSLYTLCAVPPRPHAPYRHGVYKCGERASPLFGSDREGKWCVLILRDRQLPRHQPNTERE